MMEMTFQPKVDRSISKFVKVLLSTMLVLLSSCGSFIGSPDDPKKDAQEVSVDEKNVTSEISDTLAGIEAIPESVPSDSSGSNVAVNLSFLGSDAGEKFSLVSSAEDGLTLESGIVITVAKLNIAMIKFKADKEESDNEKALKEKMNARSKARDQEEDNDDAEEEAEDDVENASLVDSQAADKGAKPEGKGDVDGAKPEDVDSQKSAADDKKLARDGKKADRENQEKADSDDEANIDKSTKVKGPFVVDLLAHTVTPALENIDMKDGTYKRIEFMLKRYRGTEGDPLNNNSLYVEGYFLDDDGAKVTFAIMYGKTEHIRIAGDSGFKVGEGSLAMVFDIKAWFKGVDLSGFKDEARSKNAERLNTALTDLESTDPNRAARIKERLAGADDRMAQAAAKRDEMIRTKLGIPSTIDLIVHARLSKSQSVRDTLKRIKFNIKNKIKVGKKDKEGRVDTSKSDIKGETDPDTTDVDELEFEKEDQADD